MFANFDRITRSPTTSIGKETGSYGTAVASFISIEMGRLSNRLIRLHVLILAAPTILLLDLAKYRWLTWAWIERRNRDLRFGTHAVPTRCSVSLDAHRT